MALKERVNREGGTSVAGFSVRGGKASVQYVEDDLNDLDDDILTLVGKVETRGDGRLQRKLPAAHPRWPWMYVEQISNIRGLGVGIDTLGRQPVDAPVLGSYAEFPRYELSVDYTPRPYAVLPDDAVTLVEGQTWTDEDGNPQTYSYAKEWLRFGDYEILPAPDVITAQQGESVFRRNDASAPDGFTYVGMPRITMPKATLKFRWSQVPSTYVDSDNSFILQFLGRINQKPWFGYAAGQVLYIGVGITRYTPPFPDREIYNGYTAYSTLKWCDLEFHLDITERTSPSVPTPSNGNWIAAGHNLLPWFGDRRFYYGTTKPTPDLAANRVPTYLSFPMELLFTDPDA